MFGADSALLSFMSTCKCRFQYMHLMHGVTTPNDSLHLLFTLFIMFVDDKTIEFYEYATFFNTLLAQVKMATAREVKFNDLITKADIDGDDMLTAAELWSIVAPSDTNSKVT